MKSLQGKVAVITGGASGIGLALAHKAADEGMKVVIADINSDQLEQAGAAIRSAHAHQAGCEIITSVTDVANADAIHNLARLAIESFGGVHLLCNNAGVGGGGKCWELDLDYWDWVLNINLKGVINGIREFTPHMIAQNEGHIVNTASIAGLMSAPDTGPYTVSKHAVVALSEVLAGDLRREGADNVGVSVLCPSFVNTNIYRSERNRPVSEELAKSPERNAELDVIEEMAGSLFATAMPTAEVAQLVFDSIRSGRFYVLTHPEGSREQVRKRMQTILDDGYPSVSGPEEFPLT